MMEENKQTTIYYKQKTYIVFGWVIPSLSIPTCEQALLPTIVSDRL